MTSWRTPSKTWERVQFLNPQTNGTCLNEFPEIVSFVTKPICWAVRIEPLDLSGPVSKQVLWNYSDQCHAQLVASKNGHGWPLWRPCVTHIPVQLVFGGSDHILLLYGIPDRLNGMMSHRNFKEATEILAGLDRDLKWRILVKYSKVRSEPTHILMV